MNEELKCSDCGKEMRKATFDDMNGLVWADWLQQYLCPECHRRRASHINIAQ